MPTDPASPRPPVRELTGATFLVGLQERIEHTPVSAALRGRVCICVREDARYIFLDVVLGGTVTHAYTLGIAEDTDAIVLLDYEDPIEGDGTESESAGQFTTHLGGDRELAVRFLNRYLPQDAVALRAAGPRSKSPRRRRKGAWK